MTPVPPETVERLKAINNWLDAAYGSDVRLSTLLLEAGLAPARVEQLKAAHLPAFVEGVLAFLEAFTAGPDGVRGQDVMLRIFGLYDGYPRTARSVAKFYELPHTRIQQLRDERLAFFRQTRNQDRLRTGLAYLARQLLSGETES